jgi:hypothetical protein
MTILQGLTNKSTPALSNEGIDYEGNHDDSSCDEEWDIARAIARCAASARRIVKP